MVHTQTTIERAEYAYSLRPCNYKDADSESYKNKRDFARSLAKNAGMPATPALIDAIVKVINKSE